MEHGDPGEAVPALRSALAIQRRVSGEDHGRTLHFRSDLARCYELMGRYEDAAAEFQMAVEGQKSSLGTDHADTLHSLSSLATLHNRHGDSDKARPFVAELLAARKALAETSSEAGPKNAYAWLALTSEPADLRDPESALAFALEANELGGFENPGHLDTLALAYHRTGDTTTAIRTLRKAIALLPEGDSELRSELERRLGEFEGRPG